MILSMFLALLFVLIPASIILWLWHTDDYSMLKKLHFMFLLFTMVFSGNVVSIAGYGITIGIFFVLNYYLISYVLCQHYGVVEFGEILKSHFMMTIIGVALLFPLGLLQYHGLITGTIYGTNLIDDILLDRFNSMALNVSVFYFGQLLYINSFTLIERQKSFLFEFFGRLLACMTIQSLFFYIALVMLAGQSITSAVYIGGVYEIMTKTLFSRLVMLSILAAPFYYLFQNKKKRELSHGRATT